MPGPGPDGVRVDPDHGHVATVAELVDAGPQNEAQESVSAAVRMSPGGISWVA